MEFAQKAFKNEEFLASGDARNVRILCEHVETETRLNREKVSATILVFGSARAKSQADFDRIKAKLEGEVATNPQAAIDLEHLEDGKWMCEYYDKITELSRRVTEWSMTATLGAGRDSTGASRATEGGQSIIVATGGGPGFMEASNKGAAAVEGARNMGMSISLPFEQKLNPFITPGLGFKYHYFFTRKFWMVYYCQALIVAPGGVGTMDELFEVMTLKQTGKVAKDLPIVLFGKEFWSTVVNWESLVKFGVVKRKDVDDLFITDEIEDAFKYVTERLATSANL